MDRNLIRKAHKISFRSAADIGNHGATPSEDWEDSTMKMYDMYDKFQGIC